MFFEGGFDQVSLITQAKSVETQKLKADFSIQNAVHDSCTRSLRLHTISVLKR